MRVLIAGAGPAGSSAAIIAAGLGAEVHLIDRRTFPRDKACGDGLTRGAISYLRELGVTDALEEGMHISGILLRTKGHPTIERAFHSTYGLTLPRVQLDNALVRRAIASGVSFTQGARIVAGQAGPPARLTVEMAGKLKEFEGDALVVADGASSTLRRQLEVPASAGSELRGLAIRAYATGYTPAVPRFELVLPLSFNGREHPGYGWIFPHADGRLNVGIGVFNLDERSAINPTGSLLHEFVADLRSNNDDLASLKLQGKPMAGVIRVGRFIPRARSGNTVFVGDAAGLINPISGEGIEGALLSGMTAGRLAASLGPSFSNVYVKTMNRHQVQTANLTESILSSGSLGWRFLRTIFEGRGSLLGAVRSVALDPHRGVNDVCWNIMPPEVADVLDSIDLRLIGPSLRAMCARTQLSSVELLSVARQSRTISERLADAMFCLLEIVWLLNGDIGTSVAFDAQLTHNLPLVVADLIVAHAHTLAVRAAGGAPKALTAYLREMGIARAQTALAGSARERSAGAATMAGLPANSFGHWLERSGRLEPADVDTTVRRTVMRTLKTGNGDEAIEGLGDWGDWVGSHGDCLPIPHRSASGIEGSVPSVPPE